MAKKTLKDAQVKLTLALPNGAATTTSTAIDTGKVTSQGTQPENVEWLLTAPALTTAQQPDAKTLTYSIITSDNSDLSSPTTLISGCIVQTGAGGAGAAAAEYRFRLPSDAARYLGFKAVGSATGNSSAASATLEAQF